MRYILIVFLFFLLCNDIYNGFKVTPLQAQTEPSPEGSPVNEGEDKKAKKVQEEIIQSYKYDPTGLRDPFIPLRIHKEINQTTLGPYLPLEQFDINKFKLIGIIWDTKEPRALVMDPNNKSHIIKKNDRIGLNKGHLADIRQGEIIIAEPKKQGTKVLYDIKKLTLQENKK